MVVLCLWIVISFPLEATDPGAQNLILIPFPLLFLLKIYLV